ncbi:MAG TPA: DnaJ C-terminal domain-containing protein [Anaerolineae bacterium]|nr:DnaJ C-terminal domain-containing protein [Anaerolineae bacterium]
MSATDYYKMLGISKDASDGEIKKAYRKLAMKYHPDHTKGDKADEEKFKKISEAYAVLSDKKKRSQYDTFGSTGFQQRYSQEDIFKGFNFSDILREFGMGGASFSTGKQGDMRFAFENNSPFGTRARGRQAQIKGSDLLYELHLTIQEVATGTNKTVKLQHNGHSENITVKIPKGMISGKKLRLAGKGQQSPYGGPPGDLYIQSKVLGDPVYSIKGYNLYINSEIKLSEALLGTSVSVPTVEGKELNLKIPAGTKHKTKMRLSGYGLPNMQTREKGDLFVIINIYLPKSLSDNQKSLIKQLEKAGL